MSNIDWSSVFEWSTLLKAFVVGGLICVIGQILIDKTKLTSAKINIVFFAYLCASLIFLVFIAIARFSSFFRNLVKPCKTPFVNNKLITNYFFLFIQLNSSITPFLYTLYVYFGKICNNMISSKFIISIFSLLFI